MKKLRQKILFICIAALLVGMITGCGQGVANKAPVEMSWTAKEWESASVTDKRTCALAYTEYIANATGIENVKEQIESLGDDELDEVVVSLDILFENAGEQSLKEVIDTMFAETPKATK